LERLRSIGHRHRNWPNPATVQPAEARPFAGAPPSAPTPAAASISLSTHGLENALRPPPENAAGERRCRMGRSLPCGLIWMSNAAAGELLDGLRLAQVLSLTPKPVSNVLMRLSLLCAGMN